MKHIKVALKTSYGMMNDILKKIKNSFIDFWSQFKSASWKKIVADLSIAVLIIVFMRPIGIALATIAFVSSFDDIVIGTIMSVCIGALMVTASMWAAELLIIPVAITIAQLTRQFINAFNEGMQAEPA